MIHKYSSIHSTNDCFYYNSFFSLLKLSNDLIFYFLYSANNILLHCITSANNILRNYLFLLPLYMNNLGIATFVCQNTVNALPLNFSFYIGRTGNIFINLILFHDLINCWVILETWKYLLNPWRSRMSLANIKMHVFFVNYFWPSVNFFLIGV